MQDTTEHGGRQTASVLRFADIGLDDVALVGGKNASLGEMFRTLAPRGVRVADGFAVTARAYRDFLAATGLEEVLADALADLDVADVEALRARGATIRREVTSRELPAALRTAIAAAYEDLRAGHEGDLDVAVRSSATAEDLPEASFAGQQESYLNVRGVDDLLDKVRRCFASLFTDRAISYRELHGFGHLDVALSVGVQRMVRSDLGCSGVMFTVDTESGFSDVVLINAAWGLGETVVQGSVNPDEYHVFKPTLKEGFRPLLRKTLGSKEIKLVYDTGGERRVRTEAVAAADRRRFTLDDDEVLQLARWACQVEEHYSSAHGRPTPMDLEWAKDGRSGELFILQARPETVHSQRRSDLLEIHRLRESGPVLVTGRAVGDRIGKGRVRVIRDARDLERFQDGEVLVAEHTDPDWEVVMKRAAAIVTDRGGRTCHAAIVSRELGLPAVVGCGDATNVLASGREVTVSCAEGEEGRVHEGLLDHDVEPVDLSELPRPKTGIMMNVANPDEAYRLSFIPNDGVGLMRMEFVISHAIGVHPLALTHFDRVEDAAARERIRDLTRGHDDRTGFFVDRLARGVATIAAAFHPKDVIVRLSDFKSNEYAGLLGGAAFEPDEENPMIGFRGASRYYDDRYREGFALECRAMKRVRDEMGLRNVKLMIPFCRTPAEGERVIAEMARHGLVRGEGGLEVWVMCEVPSNVIVAEQFARIFDGFSIGSNDLTQLVLGVDRDSEIIAHLFDERNDAVTRMIASVVAIAHAEGSRVGICGQAPSDHPEFAKFLVDIGIDSMSLTPDAVLPVTRRVLELEAQREAR